jgi:cobalt-zinc-cadmium efflux system outer membrane protein
LKAKRMVVSSDCGIPFRRHSHRTARSAAFLRIRGFYALVASGIALVLPVAPRALAQTAVPAPVYITLDRAIELALQHNHVLLAARTTIQQNQAQETTANLRPNPNFFADWDYLPVFSPTAQNSSYLQGSTEADAGLSYLIERGEKRQHRLEAAKDATAVAMSQVADNERTLTFQVAAQFINVQLAESTLELAQDNLKSYQNTLDIAEIRYRSGAISQDDYLKVKLQLLQFQSDFAQAQVAKLQALSDLRGSLGFEAVPANYDVVGPFEYQPLNLTLEDLQMKALQNRPDLRAAQQGVTSAQGQYELQRAIGKQDVTVQANYTHVNGINGASFYASIPVPIFNRNQGEIARTRFAITQSQESEKAAGERVMSDVYDAYWNLRTYDQIVQLYRSGYLTEAQADRDIAEYAYQRGAASLIDFLDAERSYRTTQRVYRQALASYLLALEQLRAAIGTRSGP